MLLRFRRESEWGPAAQTQGSSLGPISALLTLAVLSPPKLRHALLFVNNESVCVQWRENHKSPVSGLLKPDL